MSNIDVSGIDETNPVQGQPTTASVRDNFAAIKTQLSTAKTELGNLSGVTDQVAARSNIGAVIGTNVQAYDATLQSMSSLGTAVDKIPYTTAVDTWAETPLTAFARTLLDDANAAAARTTLELDSSSGSSYIGFLPAGTGAVQRTIQDKLREVVSVKDFGAKGDGVTDDRAALQAAIDYCVSNKAKLSVPYGEYIISSPLFIWSWNGAAHSGYASLDLVGQKSQFQSTLHSPTITCTFDGTFAIGIQNGRAVRIKDILIKGQNDYSANLVDANRVELLSNSTYVIGTCRDSRYSPYAGICIDPFGTSAPSDGGYPGLSAYYTTGAAGSSYVELDGVGVRGFVVGVILSPNGVTQNAEDITLNRVQLLYNKVGVAICQSQSRRMSFNDGDVLGALYAFDGASYGARQGFAPIINGANIGWVKYIFNVTQAYDGPVKANAIHAETFASIGFVGYGNSTSSFPSKISNSLFNVYAFDGRAADIFFRAHSEVIFESCDFNIGTLSGADKFPVLRFQMMTIDRGSILFLGCQLQASSDTETELPIAPSSNIKLGFGSGFRFVDCSVREGSTKNSGNSYLSDNYFMHNYNGVDKSYSPSYALLHDSYSGSAAGEIKVISNRSAHSYSLGSLTVTAGSNGQATFTVAGDISRVRLGDLIYTTTAISVETGAPSGSSVLATNYLCLGMVSNISGSDVTISGIPQSLTTGVYALETQWWTRIHKPSTGDISTGTNTILNVTNPTTWAVGHKIMGAGIPVGAYVTNVAGTTVTISVNATATTTGIRLYDSDVYQITGTAV